MGRVWLTITGYPPPLFSQLLQLKDFKLIGINGCISVDFSGLSFLVFLPILASEISRFLALVLSLEKQKRQQGCLALLAAYALLPDAYYTAEVILCQGRFWGNFVTLGAAHWKANE